MSLYTAATGSHRSREFAMPFGDAESTYEFTEQRKEILLRELLAVGDD